MNNMSEYDPRIKFVQQFSTQTIKPDFNPWYSFKNSLNIDDEFFNLYKSKK